jgi:hypothetical protein
MTRDSMSREEAIRALCLADLRTWSAEKRREQIDVMKMESWDSHPRWSSLPRDVRKEFDDGAETRSPADSRYDSVLLLALEAGFRGVRNEFLAEKLDRIVVGEVERLLPCPCCSYRTLAERGSFSICPVCFWEDDGSDDPKRLSGPNHMTLAQGRANFASFGAVTRRELAFVDPEGNAKYPRAE